MTEWSEDPMEIRATAIYNSITLNKRKPIGKVLEDATKIERYLMQAKPQATILKITKGKRK